MHIFDRIFTGHARAPEDGTGGAAPETAGAGTGDGGAPPADAVKTEGAGGSGAGGGDGAPAEPYFPDGLADNLRGANERETIDRLAGALKGYRDRDATKDLPEKAEGYLSLEGVDDKAFKADESFKPYFDQFASDPGMKAAAEVARRHGISRPAFLEAVQASMSALKEAGVLEPMVDVAAERAALLPDTARSLPEADQKAAIDRRMSDNFAFVDLMTQNGGLPKEAGEYAQLMLGDSAKGHLFLEWMRGRVQAGQGGPGAHGDGGIKGDTAESLRAEMAKLELMPGHPQFDRQKYADFEKRYRAFHATR